MDEFLNNNVEWLVLVVVYVLERLQEVQRRKKLKSEDVETDGNSKVKGRARKVAGFLFDLLPVVSRFKRRK